MRMLQFVYTSCGMLYHVASEKIEGNKTTQSMLCFSPILALYQISSYSCLISHFLLSSWPILTWICLFWVCRWVIFWLTFHCAQWLNCYHPPFHHLWWLLRRFLKWEALARLCDWEYVWFIALWDATEQGSYVSNCVDPLVSMSNNYLMHAHKILISNLDLSTVPYF